MDWLLNIGLYHYLVLALVLFCIGLCGVLIVKDSIKIMLCCGLIFSAIGINFVAFAGYGDSQNFSGDVFALFITAFIVVQTVVGVILLIAAQKCKNSEVERCKF